MEATDKQIANMEEEVKLMKGELKQSLASVRDYLLNMELPSSEFATVLAALGGGDGEQRITMKGSFEKPPAEPAAAAAGEELSGDDNPQGLADDSLEPEGEANEEPEEMGGGGFGNEHESADGQNYPGEEGFDEDQPFGEKGGLGDDSLGEEGLGEDQPYDEAEGFSPEDELLDGEAGDGGEEEEELLPEDALEEDALPPAGELPAEDEDLLEEGSPMGYEKAKAEAILDSTPRVNMLANLIGWVARAKKELGYEQMVTFLEVYGISGHLSQELKEVILHLAEVSAEIPENSGTAEVWSQAMLSLHGILTGGDAPLHPVKPYWPAGELAEEDELAEEENETEVVKTRPLKLKLVLPDADGGDREFSLDLSPAVDGNGA